MRCRYYPLVADDAWQKVWPVVMNKKRVLAKKAKKLRGIKNRSPCKSSPFFYRALCRVALLRVKRGLYSRSSLDGSAVDP